MRKPSPEIPHVEPEPGEHSFTCRGCKKLWPHRHDFISGNDGNRCRNCGRAHLRKKNSQSRNRRNHLKRTYRLTVEQFDEKLKRQGYACETCGRRIEHSKVSASGDVIGRAVIDHNHHTGKVRGLLCGSCNRGIGAFQENIVTLTKVIEYLRRYETPLDNCPETLVIPDKHDYQ